MRKLKAPRLVTISIITTATIILWIFFEVYRIFTAQPASSVPEELLVPISPSLDTQSLNNIQGRILFSEEEIPETLIPIAPPEAAPEQEPTPIPSPTAAEELEQLEETTPTPTATESAGT